jgi:hypothetical protein
MGRVICLILTTYGLACGERSRPFPTIDSAESSDSNNSQNKTNNNLFQNSESKIFYKIFALLNNNILYLQYINNLYIII